MAVEMHAHNIRQAAADLPARLTSIGCDERLSPRERRAILEALRDEMDVEPPRAARPPRRSTSFGAVRRPGARGALPSSAGDARVAGNARAGSVAGGFRINSRRLG